MPAKTRLLFVCLGNIVRSPLAENMFRRLATEAGAGERYEVDSAGTGGWHVGEPPDARMRQVAAGRGLRYSGRARQFQQGDFERFDLVIPMDMDNYASLMRLAESAEQREKIRLMRSFDPDSQPDDPVPDPYYGGISGFETTYDIIERACRGLLQILEDQGG